MNRKAGENGYWIILKNLSTFKTGTAIQSLAKRVLWEHIYNNKFIKQKMDYILNNPVNEKIVTMPEDYYFSSARNYVTLENELVVVVVVVDLF
ncbi:hypothetical protein [Flavobacterium yafengii]|uniref:hypothetical protein n=1 Tax=Flavobacterium yafengii TaxID=3041253 RepID=UPI0032BFDCAA